jgi:hypothetical protein
VLEAFISRKDAKPQSHAKKKKTKFLSVLVSLCVTLRLGVSPETSFSTSLAPDGFEVLL